MRNYDSPLWRAAREEAAAAQAAPHAQTPQAMAGQSFSGLDDPALLEYIRMGGDNGDYGRSLYGLRNMAVLRSVSVICETIGMLPLNLMEDTPDKAMAKNHPAYRLVKKKPNTWQTPYEFKSGMQLNVLEHGNAYARIVRSMGRPIGLFPMDPLATRGRLTSWEMVYDYTRPDGQTVTLQASDVLHIRDLSADGVLGISRMRMAREAISLARDLEKAAGRVFKTGVLAGGAVQVPKALSDLAYGRIKSSLNDEYSGAENAAKWMLLEEGATANPFQVTSVSAQHIENRNAQIEEVARAFGVPRPLLMMDDTSWGSGIEQLGIFFVQFGLQHWFTAWEQACARALLTDGELDELVFKFNERALLRGTLADQAAYNTAALGAGGAAPWTTQNEVRNAMDLPQSDDPAADSLRNPMTQPRNGNEPPAAT